MSTQQEKHVCYTENSRNSSKEIGDISESQRRKSVKRWKMAAGRAKLRQGQRAFNFIEKTKTILSFSQGSDEINEKSVEKITPEPSLPSAKLGSGWVEHTWSTFIERAEDDKEEALEGRALITEFQQQKFRHFFYHVLDLNNDHVISQEDFDGLNSRVRHYMAWGVNSPQYLTLTEVHDHFISYFLHTSAKFVKKEEDGFDFGERWEPAASGEENLEKESVSIEEWVDVWGETVGRARKMDHLPMWLQYYSKVLFDTINRSGSGEITKGDINLKIRLLGTF